MRRAGRRRLSAAVGAALLACSAAGAVPPASAADRDGGTPATALTDRDLRAFAAAAAEIQRISDRYRPLLDATLDHQQQLRLRRSARAEMEAAIRNAGLTPGAYGRIYGSVQSDPRARQKVAEYLRQLQ